MGDESILNRISDALPDFESISNTPELKFANARFSKNTVSTSASTVSNEGSVNVLVLQYNVPTSAGVRSTPYPIAHTSAQVLNDHFS